MHICKVLEQCLARSGAVTRFASTWSYLYNLIWTLSTQIFFFYLKGLMKLFKSYISLLFACSLSNGVEVTQLSDLGMWIGVYF